MNCLFSLEFYVGQFFEPQTKMSFFREVCHLGLPEGIPSPGSSKSNFGSEILGLTIQCEFELQTNMRTGL